MKMINVKTVIGGLTMMALLFACDSDQKTNQNHSDHDHEMMEGSQGNVDHMDQTSSGTKQMDSSPTLSAYLQIKDALLADKAENASKAAKQMLQIGEADNLDTSLKIIANSSDISEQRTAFSALSNELYKMVKSGDLSGTMYWNHCPMALDNMGANWLSTSEAIQNPYMGQRMPKCGRVEETL